MADQDISDWLTELQSLQKKENAEIEFYCIEETSADEMQNYNLEKKIAISDPNRLKNRYNVLPFDKNPYPLDSYPGVANSDYFNASPILGPGGEWLTYLATQGPLAHTLPDFWRAVWQSGSQLVLMLCALQEFDPQRGTMKAKCERYWPERLGEEIVIGHFAIKLVRESKAELNSDLIVRDLEVRLVRNAAYEAELEKRGFNSEKGSMPSGLEGLYSAEAAPVPGASASRSPSAVACNSASSSNIRRMIHIQYDKWPDKSVPSQASLLIDCVRIVRSYQSELQPPIVVHCSAGCGRTGTWIALDYVWNAIQIAKRKSLPLRSLVECTPNFVSNMRFARGSEESGSNEQGQGIGGDRFRFSLLANLVLSLRLQRQGMVQESKQYRYLLDSLCTLFQSILADKRTLEPAPCSSSPSSAPSRSSSGPFSNANPTSTQAKEQALFHRDSPSSADQDIAKPLIPPPLPPQSSKPNIQLQIAGLRLGQLPSRKLSALPPHIPISVGTANEKFTEEQPRSLLPTTNSAHLQNPGTLPQQPDEGKLLALKSTPAIPIEKMALPKENPSAPPEAKPRRSKLLQPVLNRSETDKSVPKAISAFEPVLNFGGTNLPEEIGFLPDTSPASNLPPISLADAVSRSEITPDSVLEQQAQTNTSDIPGLVEGAVASSTGREFVSTPNLTLERQTSLHLVSPVGASQSFHLLAGQGSSCTALSSYGSMASMPLVGGNQIASARPPSSSGLLEDRQIDSGFGSALAQASSAISLSTGGRTPSPCSALPVLGFRSGSRGTSPSTEQLTQSLEHDSPEEEHRGRRLSGEVFGGLAPYFFRGVNMNYTHHSPRPMGPRPPPSHWDTE